MPYFTYDTSVIISRRLVPLPRPAGNFLLSAVVLMELMASATDDSQRRIYEQLLRGYQNEGSLIIPNEDDWLLASKVLYWLTQGRRRTAKGALRRLDPGVSQRLRHRNQRSRKFHPQITAITQIRLWKSGG
jgi:hypothetical protein